MVGASAALLGCYPPASFSPTHNPRRSSAPPRPSIHGGSERQNSEAERGRTGDKSCEICKRRKIRCSRDARRCIQCTRRQEICVYPADTEFEDSADGVLPVDVRITHLESELASLLERLASDGPTLSPTSPPGRRLAPSLSAETLPKPYLQPGDLSTSILLAFVSGTDTESECLQLSEYFKFRGFGTLDGGHPQLGRLLVIDLFNAFKRTCWSRMRAYAALGASLAPYDFTSDLSLDTLSPTAQVAVVLMCALGASSQSASGIFGLSVDPTASPLADIIVVGARRESAWGRLGDLAWNVAGRVGMLWETGSTPDLGNPHPDDGAMVIGVLLGWSQWLTFQEIRPLRSRWLLKTALSRLSDLEAAGEDTRIFKSSMGSVLINLDACIASKLEARQLIPPQLAHDLLREVPEALMALSFSQIVDRLTRNPLISKTDIDLVIAAARLSISEAQACFTSAVAPPSALSAIPFLWQSLDSLHACVQRLQTFLAAITHVPRGCEGDECVVDSYVLIAVRLDLQLVELCYAVHAFLERSTSSPGGIGAELATTRTESELRIRKCLKLVAFYCQFFFSSDDRYLGYHLFVQLDLLPGWTTLATQRVGSVPGPADAECELSEKELEWLTVGLRSACFYGTSPAMRLREIAAGRGHSSLVYPYAAWSDHFSPVLLPAPSGSAPIYNPTEAYGTDPLSTPFLRSSPSYFPSELPYDTTGGLALDGLVLDGMRVDVEYRPEDWLNFSQNA